MSESVAVKAPPDTSCLFFCRGSGGRFAAPGKSDNSFFDDIYHIG